MTSARRSSIGIDCDVESEVSKPDAGRPRIHAGRLGSGANGAGARYTVSPQRVATQGKDTGR